MSVVFDGSLSNYLYRGGDLLTNTAGTAFSWVIWVKPAAAATNHGFFQYWWNADPSDDPSSTFVYRRANNYTYVGTTLPGGTTYERQVVLTEIDEWMMFGFSRPAGTGAVTSNHLFYTQTSGKAISNYNPLSPQATGGGLLRVGFSRYWGGSDFSANGKIAHLCLWDGVALTEANFDALWNSGTGANPESIESGSIAEHWDFRTGGLTGSVNSNVLTMQGTVGTDSGDNPAFTYGGDTTPPGWDAAPTVNATHSDGFIVNHDLDESCIVHAILVTNPSSAPTGSQLKQGLDSTGSAPVDYSTAASDGSAGTIDLTGYAQPGTTYDIYLCAVDPSDNTSSVQSITSQSPLNPTITNVNTTDEHYPAQSSTINGTGLNNIASVTMSDGTVTVTQTFGSAASTTVSYTAVRGNLPYTKDQDGNVLGSRTAHTLKISE